MTKKDFVIDKKLANTRISSIIQHKLRIVLKCYTIINFIINDNKTFTCNKTHRIKKIKIQDKNIISGFYEIQEINEELILLKITVN